MDYLQSSSNTAKSNITLAVPPLQPPTEANSTAQSGESLQRQSTARKELSHDEWEQLKPIIKRMYIDENQSFKLIQRFFTSEYQSTPTTEKWGFGKNIKKKVRDAILRSVDDAALLHTIPAAKLWKIRKRYGNKQERSQQQAT
ncbi:hypothetical protein ACMFMG_011696 [Clarireedia jacksonii]